LQQLVVLDSYMWKCKKKNNNLRLIVILNY
jgi:hypothetical protein